MRKLRRCSMQGLSMSVCPCCNRRFTSASYKRYLNYREVVRSLRENVEVDHLRPKPEAIALDKRERHQQSSRQFLATGETKCA